MIFSFDLGEEIYNSFGSVFDKGLSDDYLNSAYSSQYPEDPFLETYNSLDGMQKQIKVAGAQYIENELRANNCALTKKQIWGILYYFVPEFKAEIAGGLKKQGGHKSSRDLSFDKSKIKKYCEEYYHCIQKANSGYDELGFGRRKYKISASTPEDVMTECKEYFQRAYALGSENEKRMQGVKKSRAGSDKFWNATTDDSPYDIMLDFNAVGVFLFEGSVEPITPVFYNLPVFSNSSQSLLNSMNSGFSGSVGGNSGNSAGTGTRPSVGGNINNVASASISVGGSSNNVASTSMGSSVGGSSNNATTVSMGFSVGGSSENSIGVGGRDSTESSENGDSTQISGKERESLGTDNNGGNQGRSDSAGKSGVDESKTDNGGFVVSLDEGGVDSGFLLDVYDELVDGLGTKSIADKGTLFYGSLCKDEEIESEPEGNNEIIQEGGTNVFIGGSDEPILSEEEYQEMVDYMLTAVDQYSVLPQEIQENIMGLIASLNNVNPEGGYNTPNTPDISDEAVNQIKSCAQSCEGLRPDQYLSCLEMCACAERTSSIFDPEGGLGLGPIAKIKFCTVPGMDMSFSEGGRKIISIEEGGSEILGVVDKLSREGKLGVWTKQSNFLDSSTKKIKIDKVISFSIDVQSVDIGEKPKESSEQYENMMLKNLNKRLQKKYSISRPLNDPSNKNEYNVGGGEDVEESQSDRYVFTSEALGQFLDQQATLWEVMFKSMEKMTDYADALSEKKG